MVSELGLDRAVDEAQFTGKYHFVELGDHLALGELAQVSALLSEGHWECLRRLGEIGPGFDLLLEILAGLLGGDEDMARVLVA